MGSFFKSLFDLKFEHFITRKISGIFYAICLGAIGLFAIFAFFGGLFSSFQMISYGYGSSGLGFATLLVTIVLVPVLTFIAVIVTRLIFESSVALVAVAENTKK